MTCLVDKEKAADVMCVNFSKAFGNALHGILPRKLNHHNMGAQLIENHSQRAAMPKVDISNGVSWYQILFNIFINVWGDITGVCLYYLWMAPS